MPKIKGKNLNEHVFYSKIHIVIGIRYFKKKAG